MAKDLSQPPFHMPPLWGVTAKLVRQWINWLVSITDRVNTAPYQLQNVALTGQQAAISATAISLGTLDAGLYWVTTYVRITSEVAGSALRLTIGFTTGGAARSFVGTYLTENITVQSNSYLIRIDQGSSITYATEYSSPGAMQYQLDILVNAVKGSGT